MLYLATTSSSNFEQYLHSINSVLPPSLNHFVAENVFNEAANLKRLTSVLTVSAVDSLKSVLPVLHGSVEQIGLTCEHLSIGEDSHQAVEWSHQWPLHPFHGLLFQICHDLSPCCMQDPSRRLLNQFQGG